MRALVTGAAGFIGSHLCRRLVTEGNEVVGLDDLSDGTIENLRNVPAVRFVEGDIRDKDAALGASAGCDVIFHLAAMRSVPRSVRLPELTADVNVRGTLNVLLAAMEESAAVVFASSSSVYGDQSAFPLREEMEPRPRSPYAATKLAGEALCGAWWHSYSVAAISLRYFNVYGPGQDPSSEYAAVIPRFAIACLTNQPPIIHGDGEQARDFTYIDDVVEANMLAAREPARAAGRVLNVGGGREPTSINRVLELIAAELRAEVRPIHEPPREGDVRRTEADISLARELIHYEPRVGIQEGLRRTVGEFRSSQGAGITTTNDDARPAAEAGVD